LIQRWHDHDEEKDEWELRFFEFKLVLTGKGQRVAKRDTKGLRRGLLKGRDMQGGSQGLTFKEGDCLFSWLFNKQGLAMRERDLSVPLPGLTKSL